MNAPNLAFIRRNAFDRWVSIIKVQIMSKLCVKFEGNALKTVGVAETQVLMINLLQTISKYTKGPQLS